MAIKVDVRPAEAAPATKRYPWIGVSKSGLVAFFDGPGSGTCLHDSTDAHLIGEHRTDWREDVFTPLNGTITLQNEAN